jgi:hypothetical protein
MSEPGLGLAVRAPVIPSTESAVARTPKPYRLLFANGREALVSLTHNSRS